MAQIASSIEHSNGINGARHRNGKASHLSTVASIKEDSFRESSPAGRTGVSSGRATPIPEDAPPSVRSISFARQNVRAQQKKRIFPTVNYSERVSHFDPRSDYHNFKGFFVLFWVGLAIMVVTTTARNWKETGLPLRVYTYQLLSTDVIALSISDFFMVLTTLFVVPEQQLFRKSKVFAWAKGGMPTHSVLQAAWFTLWINWPFILRWTWTAQVFFTLHTIVILMKIHSYSFYNGHLGTTEKRLSELDNPTDAMVLIPAERYPSPSRSRFEIGEQVAKEQNPFADAFSLAQLREDLAHELTSPLGNITYPQNLTYTNYADYILCPTLCYELEYPRSKEGIRWMELFWKGLAVFGCIFLLITVSEEFILPVLGEAALQLQTPYLKTSDQVLIMAETISQLLFPFMITMLLVFLVIFEYVLGCFAEITCFADRHFYSDWWNSCDWLEFSRKWNVPVHHFLRRHVYGASLPYLSKNGATTVTFFVSAILHELVMGCITKKMRGYGFFLMMLQIPLVGIQNTKFLKGKKLFNNVAFWVSIILGLALICALYVLL